MSTGERLYEPLLPPLHSLTPTNRGPLVLVTGNTLVVITTLTVVVKLCTRYATTRTLGLNDAAMMAATCCAIAHTVSIDRAVSYGLGRHTDAVADMDKVGLSKAYYASNILFVLALALAKVSVTLLTIAIGPRKRVMYACYGTLVFILTWGVASALVLALQCSPNRWALGPSSGPDPQTCIDQYTMQIVIRATDIASDLALVALPVLMMQTVQVAREKRLMVNMLFGLRIATPIFSVISLLSLHDFYHSQPEDRTWLAVTPAVWTAAAMNVSIVTACIPSIKRFLADWAAGLSKTQITEPFELELTGGIATSSGTYAQGSRLGSKLATRLGLKSENKDEGSWTRSGRGERDNATSRNIHARTSGRRAHNGPEQDTSDSVKGLTQGVILQTTDYSVEFEETNNREHGHGSCSSRGRDGTEAR